MFAGDLGVDEVEIVVLGELAEVGKCGFGGVSGMVIHGLAEEGFAEGDAVEAADEVSVLVGFEGVGEAELV